MASAKEIARLVAPTLDLCSQHEHQALMRPSTHLSLLDAWARDSVSEAHAAYLSAFEAAKRAADELSRVKAAGEASTARLDEARFMLQRMAALQGLLRAFGPRLSDVIAAREEAAELVSLVDDAEERERAAAQALEAAERDLAEAASALDGARRKMAPRFARAVSKVMARLEMGSASLECEVSELPREKWTKEGPHQVEFMFRPGSGMQARPLARIASGGEVSRVMLSIKVALGEADSVDTLLFDEVDAGVGGATAVALASVLTDLAKTHQVIVVTHLAQVAVAADVHYVVRKTQGDVPETSLSVVSGEDRATEIARMLSGDVTDASLAHAREMLHNASGE